MSPVMKPNTAIYLSSPGGSLIEGLKLGYLFKEMRIKTVVEGGVTARREQFFLDAGATNLDWTKADRAVVDPVSRDSPLCACCRSIHRTQTACFDLAFW
jgi:hypothetical protein